MIASSMNVVQYRIENSAKLPALILILKDIHEKAYCKRGYLDAAERAVLNGFTQIQLKENYELRYGIGNLPAEFVRCYCDRKSSILRDGGKSLLLVDKIIKELETKKID